MIYNTDP